MSKYKGGKSCQRKRGMDDMSRFARTNRYSLHAQHIDAGLVEHSSKHRSSSKYLRWVTNGDTQGEPYTSTACFVVTSGVTSLRDYQDPFSHSCVISVYNPSIMRAYTQLTYTRSTALYREASVGAWASSGSSLDSTAWAAA